MDETTTAIERFIEDAELVVMDMRRMDSRDSGPFKNHPRWSVTIAKRGDERTLRTPFHMGREDMDRPELSNVLDCMAADCAGYGNAPNFRDWCAEYGYDPDDDDQARVTFDAVKVQADRLYLLLGPELYGRLVWHTERL